MASHRRQKLTQTASTEIYSPAVESTTTLIPIITGNEKVGTAPSVPIRQIFRRFWPDTKGFRGRLVFGLLLVGVPPLLSAIGIWLFKVLVDDVLTTKDLARFPYVAAAFMAVTVAEGIVGFVDEYVTAWVGERFVLNLRSRLFDHLQRLSLTFFERHQLGDILSRLSGDIGAIEQLILSGINQTLTYLFQIVFFAGALFVLDWRLASAALVAAPAFLLLARIFSRKIKKASQEQRRRSGAITSVAEESLHNTALVQAYHQQDHESARFRRENLGSFTAQMMAIKLEALFAPFTDLLQAAGVLAVVGLGIKELIAGRITLGGLLVFIGYLSQLYGPISGLGNLTNSIFAASAGAERVIEVLDTEPEVTDPAEPVALGPARGELRVDRVTFRYPDSTRPALTEVSFSARPGETVAVVGASGAGKSTLLRILLRLHDPLSGAVTLDGVDLRDLELAELRSNVAVVLQETLVFDGTVAENISWGRPDATLEHVAAAARAADAHQFITALPQGYQTRIGQRGMMLSGGQRQRIALARAMIRDAPVLLLDEPTTGLDAVSTQRVMEPLRRAMSGRTTIVISHNLLTVTDADRIVYLERGRVAGCGTHQELVASAPGYAELYRLHHPDARHRALPAPVPGRHPSPPARPAHPTRPANPAQRSRPDPAQRSRPSRPRPGAPLAGPVPPVRTRPSPRPRPGGAPASIGSTATGSPEPRPSSSPPRPAPTSSPRPTPTSSPRPTPTSPRRPAPTSPPRPAPTSPPRPAPTSPPRVAPTSSPRSGEPRRPHPVPAPRPGPVDVGPPYRPVTTNPPTARPTALQPPRSTRRALSAPPAISQPMPSRPSSPPPRGFPTRAPQPGPRPAPTPTPQPIPTPTPKPGRVRPAIPKPEPVRAAAPKPEPVRRATPVGHPAPSAIPIAAPRPTPTPLPLPLPIPLPIPLPREAPSDVRPVPRWSAGEPFGADEANR